MIVKTKLESIHPNPYQPESRLNIPDETAEKFGKSILEHGLLQTPVARHINDSLITKHDPYNGHYEVGDGCQATYYRHLDGSGKCTGRTDKQYMPAENDEDETGDIPCLTCANDGVSCHREHFESTDDGDGYVCDQRVLKLVGV